MTTLQNYPAVIARIGVANLNESQRKAHEFILKYSANLSNLAQLEKLMAANETIRKTVSLWLDKVDDLATPKPAEKPTEADQPPLPPKKPLNAKRKLKAIKTKGKAKGVKRAKVAQGKTASTFADRMRQARAAKATDSEKSDKPASEKPADSEKSDKPAPAKGRTKTKPRFKVGDYADAVDYGTAGPVVEMSWDGWEWVVVLKVQDGDQIEYPEHALIKRAKPASAKKSGSAKKPVTAKPRKEKVVKEKPVKPPTIAQRAETAYQSADKVAQIQEEVKHLKTFIGLANRASTKEEIVRACIRLQKAFTTRKIRATSTLAKEMKALEAAYIEAAKKGPFRIDVDAETLARYVTIVGGQKLYKSVDIVSRFVGWGDQAKTKGQIEKFLKEIKNAATRVLVGDPYAAKVKLIIKELEAAASKVSHTFDLDKYELSGLAGLLGCACKNNLGNPYADVVLKPGMYAKNIHGEVYKVVKDLGEGDYLVLWPDGKKGLASSGAMPHKTTEKVFLAAKKAGKNKSSSGKKSLAGLDYQDEPAVITLVTPPARVSMAQPAISPASRTASQPAIAVAMRNRHIMSSHEVVAHDYPTYHFKNDPKTNDWLDLFGEPQRPFRAMLSGGPGSGKSTLLIQLGNYLAKTFGKTLYVSSEEYSPQNGPSKTLADKIQRGGGAVAGLDFAHGVEQWNGHEFMLVDSVNHAKWSLPDMLAWSHKHPQVSILMIFQFTKDGKFKGVNEWPHEVDTVIKVDNGIARTEKNRFKELSQIQVFKNA